MDKPITEKEHHDNNLKEKLIYENQYMNAPLVYETTVEDGSPKDPLLFKKISLGSDYYSLTWACLKVSLFKDKELRGQKIYLLPADYFYLYLRFIIFMLMLALTIILVVRNVVIDDVYKEGSFAVIGCRIILMIFAMKSLTPEFKTGYSKYLYSVRHRSEFTYPGFAQFVGLCQIVCAGIALVGVLFFVCTADEFGELLTNFSGLCILSELDDWLGDMILTSKLQDEALEEIDEDDDDLTKKNKLARNANIRNECNTRDLNERMNIMQKMAMIEDEDLEIFIKDDISANCHWIIVWFDKINKIIPWDFLIPLSAIPISYGMPYIREHIILRYL